MMLYCSKSISKTNTWNNSCVKYSRIRDFSYPYFPIQEQTLPYFSQQVSRNYPEFISCFKAWTFIWGMGELILHSSIVKAFPITRAWLPITKWWKGTWDGLIFPLCGYLSGMVNGADRVLAGVFFLEVGLGAGFSSDANFEIFLICP